MKNAIIAALLLAGTIGFGQAKPEGKPRHERVEMTTEQKNDIRLKKLTLALDLNASQQKEMKKIIEDQSAKRSTAMAKMKENRDKGVKPTADEVYAMQSKRLDEQIELKGKMKKLLSDEQFAKWETMAKSRNDHFRKGAHKHLRKSPEPQEQPQK